MATLGARLDDVLWRKAKACAAAGRNPADVLLVAVSKFHPAESIREAAARGQIDFGENYVQEALEKMALLDDPKLVWHMIGHVQSRKAAQVAGKFALLHTLDSVRLANALEKSLAARDLRQRTLIEVNIGGEAQKAGVLAENLHELCGHVLANCPHLELQGLMCLPPVFDAGEAARPYFARLRELRDSLARDSGLELPHLSMGMSGDFEWAIAEGATIVRVGTDIFGPRPVKNI